ncbi:phosphoenolpyruvate--protein phosphotransferase [Rhodovastum atsumiense]|uniref:Phosphoenolpyruvate-protein phosphotransferase n=1 Tax=Rhodovastum atsumiense TaxID=504468 RepID=A0A5M6IS26_9PROT|nr:phosphoenolpyruvate--protein phosphotransferase [Rhodovastum atsumiense]
MREPDETAPPADQPEGEAARPPRRRPRSPVPQQDERRLNGIPVSAGVAIGPVFGATEPRTKMVRQKIAAADIPAQATRLDAAVAQSRKQVLKLRARLGMLPENSQAEITPLLDAYLQMLGPSRLVRGARRRVTEMLVSAETAVADETEAIAAAIMAVPGDDDPAGKARRAGEVREVGRRLVRNLTQTPFRSFASVPEGSVLVCESLRPADAALLDPSRLGGVATDEGGSDGHTAVMLRALGLPAVLGVPGLSQAARPGDTVVVDGAAGTVVIHPDPATLAAARRAVTAFARERQKLARLRRLPAITADGQTVELQANMEIPAELPLVAQAGAAGIGLLRSEFLFMNRETLPDEQAQTETYRTIIEAMAGDPVTIRVLDWSGEKDIEALQSEGVVPEVGEQNPALGLRGIRLLLRRPELFETQLAAILRAATAGPTRVLLPMVTTVGEVRAAREVYERVVRRLRRRGERLPDPIPPLGIMIETPGAALSADALALEADFFAIGTNDLTMYTLAVDRSESDVASLYDPLHPAVLRLVQFATEAALRIRKPVSVCGELAANPRLTPLLLGLGLRSFSMNASAVPRVKQAVRAVSIDDCARFARRVMEQSDPVKIQALVMGAGEAAE